MGSAGASGVAAVTGTGSEQWSVAGPLTAAGVVTLLMAGYLAARRLAQLREEREPPTEVHVKYCCGSASPGSSSSASSPEGARGAKPGRSPGRFSSPLRSPGIVPVDDAGLTSRTSSSSTPLP